MKVPYDDDTNKLSDFRGLLQQQKQVTYDLNNVDSMYGKLTQNSNILSKFLVFGSTSTNKKDKKKTDDTKHDHLNDLVDNKTDEITQQRFWMSDKNSTQCSECGTTFHTFRRKQLSVRVCICIWC